MESNTAINATYGDRQTARGSAEVGIEEHSPLHSVMFGIDWYRTGRLAGIPSPTYNFDRRTMDMELHLVRPTRVSKSV